MADEQVVAVELKLPGYVRSSDAWRNTFAAVNSLRALIIHHRMGVSGYMDWTIKLALMASYSKHSELAQNGLRVTADMWRWVTNGTIVTFLVGILRVAYYDCRCGVYH